MSWTSPESALCYDEWAQTPQGMFALRQEERLLRGLLAPWPRRKRRLLDLGCGTGQFLDFFWSSGFDLTGLDKSPAMLARAKEKMGQRVDFHLGQGEHLPFADHEFDYVSIMTVLEFVDDPGAVLHEAARVARLGILVTFLNRFSLYGLSVRLARKKSSLAQAHWFTWAEMRRLLRTTIPIASWQARSILLGPPATWKESLLFRQINSQTLFPWLGAFCAVRLDLTVSRVQTPLLAWKRDPTVVLEKIPGAFSNLS